MRMALTPSRFRAWFPLSTCPWLRFCFLYFLVHEPVHTYTVPQSKRLWASYQGLPDFGVSKLNKRSSTKKLESLAADTEVPWEKFYRRQTVTNNSVFYHRYWIPKQFTKANHPEDITHAPWSAAGFRRCSACWPSCYWGKGWARAATLPASCQSAWDSSRYRGNRPQSVNYSNL